MVPLEAFTIFLLLVLCGGLFLIVLEWSDLVNFSILAVRRCTVFFALWL
jgi:hypothetical protein